LALERLAPFRLARRRLAPYRLARWRLAPRRAPPRRAATASRRLATAYGLATSRPPAPSTAPASIAASPHAPRFRIPAGSPRSLPPSRSRQSDTQQPSHCRWPVAVSGSGHGGGDADPAGADPPGAAVGNGNARAAARE